MEKVSRLKIFLIEFHQIVVVVVCVLFLWKKGGKGGELVGQGKIGFFFSSQ